MFLFAFIGIYWFTNSAWGKCILSLFLQYRCNYGRLPRPLFQLTLLTAFTTKRQLSAVSRRRLSWVPVVLSKLKTVIQLFIQIAGESRNQYGRRCCVLCGRERWQKFIRTRTLKMLCPEIHTYANTAFFFNFFLKHTTEPTGTPEQSPGHFSSFRVGSGKTKNAVLRALVIETNIRPEYTLYTQRKNAPEYACTPIFVYIRSCSNIDPIIRCSNMGFG